MKVSKSPPRRGALTLAALMGLVLLASACGSSKDSNKTASSSATSSAAGASSVATSSAAGPSSAETSSSAAAAPTGNKDLKLGVIYLDTQGFYGGVKKGITDGAKAAGQTVNIVETNAQDDASKESTFMSNLVAQKVDAILLSASSSTASVPAIKSAADAGIPVVCYNTCIAEPDLSKYVTAYTLGDPIDFGYKLGLAAGDYFTSKNITAPKFGVVNCEFVEVCIERRKGFEKALKEKVPGYKIVANQKGGDASASLTAAQNMLTANSDLDALMGEYGDATIGAVKAVENAGKKGKTVVFGGDMTTDIANALKDNSVLKAQVDIGGQTMGKTAVDVAIQALNGKKPEKVVVPVAVDIYPTPASAQDWLTAHADGIP